MLKCETCIVEQYQEQCNRNNVMDTITSLYVLHLIDIRAVVCMCSMQLHCWWFLVAYSNWVRNSMSLTSVSCPKRSCVTPFCSFVLRWQGSTKRTLCGIVSFKLDTNFSMCFECRRDSLVLILGIPAYLGLRGFDLFQTSGNFFWHLFLYKLAYFNLQYIIQPLLNKLLRVICNLLKQLYVTTIVYCDTSFSGVSSRIFFFFATS